MLKWVSDTYPSSICVDPSCRSCLTGTGEGRGVGDILGKKGGATLWWLPWKPLGSDGGTCLWDREVPANGPWVRTAGGTLRQVGP